MLDMTRAREDTFREGGLERFLKGGDNPRGPRSSARSHSTPEAERGGPEARCCLDYPDLASLGWRAVTQEGPVLLVHTLPLQLLFLFWNLLSF